MHRTTPRSPLRVLAITLVASLLFAACGSEAETSSPSAVNQPPMPRAASPTVAPVNCDPPNGWSVARFWNEQILSAIRLDFPAPTTHSRNLFHLSAAMWDAWAAYDPSARGLFVDETRATDDIDRARTEAISHAAHRMLVHRYERAVFGAEETLDALESAMERLCLEPVLDPTDLDSDAAFGERIAETIIAATIGDGSNEDDRYAAKFEPVNEPLIILEPGAAPADPDSWQPLHFDRAFSQHGQALPSPIQIFVGPQWGSVTPFALEPDMAGLPIDPGPPPRHADPDTRQAYRDAAVDVLRFSATLDPEDGINIDISPRSRGNSTLGTDDGSGHGDNPATGERYEANVVAEGDYGRVVAEFWADGPDSETPPGHWNTLANTAGDDRRIDRRIGGSGDVVDRLEWDVKLYVALNGALHDAAIAAWGTKAHYNSVRPITMIRWLAGNGQVSDPALPNYSPDGIDLVDGLVELITTESSAPGGPHEHLADHVGEIAVRAWTGYVEHPDTEVAGVGWIRGVEWLPYQQSTFVTPAFAGYVSGHSAFSRAGAEVLTAFTGDEFFPGGMGTWTVERGDLRFEGGPDAAIELQWATYFDAADEAGTSRMYGGIHIRPDDYEGRLIGAEAGRRAWAKAREYFGDHSVGS